MRLEIRGRTIAQEGVTQLGLQGDSGMEAVEFLLPRRYNAVDLAQGTAFLLYAASGESGYMALSKEVRENEVLLTWQVGGAATARPGSVEVQLKVSGLEAELWHSEIARFYVARSLAEASAQAMVASSKRARMANPEMEPCITVAERQLLIPKELQNIAVQNDENSESVRLVMPRRFDNHDLSLYSVFLRTLNSRGEFDPIALTVEPAATELGMVWTLRPPQTSYAGRLSIQVEVRGEDFLWQTASAELNILTQLAGEPVVPVEPPIMEEFLQRIAAMEQRVKASEAGAKASEGSARDSAKSAADSASKAAGSAADARVSAESAKKSETGAAGSLTDIESGLQSRLPIAEANALLRGVAIDSETGVFTFTRYDGSTFTIDTGLERVVLDMRIDPDTLDLVLTLADGTEQRVSLVPFLNLYEGAKTATVSTRVNGAAIEAHVRGGSVALSLLTPQLQDVIAGKVTANQEGNASQIKFGDGQTMQQKLDSGELHGRDGVAVEQNGLFYMRVDEFGHLKVGVPEDVGPPPLSIRSGRLIYTIS